MTGILARRSTSGAGLLRHRRCTVAFMVRVIGAHGRSRSALTYRAESRSTQYRSRICRRFNPVLPILLHRMAIRWPEDGPPWRLTLMPDTAMGKLAKLGLPARAGGMRKRLEVDLPPARRADRCRMPWPPADPDQD